MKFIRGRDGEIRTVMVPRHSEITIGTLRSIVRHAGMTLEEFEQL